MHWKNLNNQSIVLNKIQITQFELSWSNLSFSWSSLSFPEKIFSVKSFWHILSDYWSALMLDAINSGLWRFRLYQTRLGKTRVSMSRTHWTFTQITIPHIAIWTSVGDVVPCTALIQNVKSKSTKICAVCWPEQEAHALKECKGIPVGCWK